MRLTLSGPMWNWCLNALGGLIFCRLNFERLSAEAPKLFKLLPLLPPLVNEVAEILLEWPVLGPGVAFDLVGEDGEPEFEEWRRNVLLRDAVALSSDAPDTRESDCMRFRMDGRRVGRPDDAGFELDAWLALELGLGIASLVFWVGRGVALEEGKESSTGELTED